LKSIKIVGRILRSFLRAEADQRIAGVWCGVGVMNQLIQAAVEHSRQRGAMVVEAYPVDPESPSYRFMGFVPQFREFGFVEVGIAGSRRHVMRLKLQGPFDRTERVGIEA
jgi:hypothetical protein